MLNKEEKNQLRKIFFVDKNLLYLAAQKLDEFSEIPLSVIEELFFSQDFTRKFSPVEFCQFYNQEKQWIANWFLDFEQIVDQQDWNFHQSKLCSHFLRISPVDNGSELEISNQKTRLFYYMNQWNDWLRNFHHFHLNKISPKTNQNDWIFWNFLNLCIKNPENQDSILDFLQKNQHVSFSKLIKDYPKKIQQQTIQEHQSILSKFYEIIQSYDSYYQLNQKLTIKDKVKKILKI